MITSGTVTSPMVTEMQCPLGTEEMSIPLKDFVKASEEATESDKTSFGYRGVKIDGRKVMTFTANADGRPMVFYGIRTTVQRGSDNVALPQVKVTKKSGEKIESVEVREEKDKEGKVSHFAMNTEPSSEFTIEVVLETKDGKEQLADVKYEMVFCVKKGKSFASTCYFR